MVEVDVPLATTGDVPVIDEFAGSAIGDVKTTAPPIFTIGVAIERVLVSAVAEASVQLAIPSTEVAEQVPTVLLEPVAVKVGVWPGTGLLLESLSMMVIVEVAVPLATTGDVPVMEEFAGSAVGVVNTTLLPVFTIGVAIESVLVSAVSELKVQVEIPDVLEDEQVP